MAKKLSGSKRSKTSCSLTHMTKRSSANEYQVNNPKVGNVLHGLIDPRRYVEYKDFMQMPDDKSAPSNCSPRAFQVEVYYEDDKILDN